MTQLPASQRSQAPGCPRRAFTGPRAASLYLRGLLGQPVDGLRVVLHLLQLLQGLVFQGLHRSLWTQDGADVRAEAGGVQTDELPEGAPRQGGSRGGRGPISCAPAALPSPLPREVLLPPKHGQQDVRTRSAAREAQTALPEEQMGGERRAPQPGAGRNRPQAMPAPTLARVYLHPDQEYVHPHPGLAGCASTAPNAAAGYS